MVSLTFYVAFFEAPLRQSGFRFLQSGDSGLSYLRRLVRVSSAVGALIVATSILLLWRLNFVSSLVPIVFVSVVPVLTGLYLLPLLAAQRRGDWRLVFGVRFASVGISLAASIPLILHGFAQAGVATQLVFAEFIAILLFRLMRIRSADQMAARTEEPRVGLRRDLAGTRALSAFGWVRGQVDRLVLIIGASIVSLGLYSLAYAVARAPAEAVIAGSVNRLRASLSHLSSDLEISAVGEHARRYIVRVQSLMGFVFVLTLTLSVVLDRFLLGPEWDSSMMVVPVLSASVFSAAFSSSINAVLNHCGMSRRSYPVQIVEIFLGVLVGVLVAIDIRWGAVAFFVRELIGAFLLSIAARGLIKRLTRLWFPGSMSALLLGMAVAIL